MDSWILDLQNEAITTEPADLEVFIDCPPSHPEDREKFSGLMIVGEAPGENEQKYGIPFHPDGVAGKILRHQLNRIDTKHDHPIALAPESCWITNVFKERPPRNRIDAFFDREEWEETRDIPPRKGRHLIGGYRDNLLYLWKEILEYAKPELILACGAVPLWFFTGYDRIGDHRGTIEDFDGEPFGNTEFSVLYTYHPMATIYNPRCRELFEEDIGLLKQTWLEKRNA